MAFEAVAAVVAVVGATIGGLSAEKGAEASQANAKYQSQVANNNAVLAQRAAQRATEQGNIQAQEKANQTAQLEARQRAVLAGNGLDVSSGTSLDILGDTAAVGANDKQTILNNANYTANGYLQQGMNFNASSELYAANANNISPGVDAFGTALDGLGTVASKWYQYNQTTALPQTDDYALSGGKL